MAVGDELSTLNFDSMIGGPLNSMIRAQAQSARTSVDFIRSVGFQAADGENPNPTMVTFEYEKPVANPDADGGYQTQQYKLTVPILTMLPVPFIRVSETNVEFNAKINSIQESTTAYSDTVNASTQGSVGWGPFSAQIQASYSHQGSTVDGSKVERTYSMSVSVKAVQEELPAGTERLLHILESNIQEEKISDGTSSRSSQRSGSTR